MLSRVVLGSFKDAASRLHPRGITSNLLNSRNMSTNSPLNGRESSLIVLDDYLGLSQRHFTHVKGTLSKFTTLDYYLPQHTPPEQDHFVKTLQPYSMISTMRERSQFPGHILRRLPNLKLLLCTGTQFETFDLQAARELGITVVAAPGVGRTDDSPGERAKVLNIKKGGNHPATHHTWAMILALARNISTDDQVVRSSGGWQTAPAIGLAGKTLGIVGFGRLGAAVARIGTLAFGMRVVCWSSSLTQDKADTTAVNLGLPVEDEFGEKTFQVVSKEELFRQSDVVSVHYVLSPRSRHIIAKDEFELMKKDALIVNTSRGPLVHEDALLETLRSGMIGGAALDVFEHEPLPKDSLWRTERWGEDGRSRVLVTPHMGYVEEELMARWYAETAENVERWLDGREVLHRLV